MAHEGLAYKQRGLGLIAPLLIAIKRIRPIFLIS